MGIGTAHGQSDTLVLDHNLTLVFPAKTDSSLRKGIVVFFAYTPEASYMASVNQGRPFDIRDRTHFNRVLNASVKGFFSTANTKYFKKEVRDTVIGGANGKFIHAYDTRDSLGFKEIFCFMTIRDARVYVVQASIRKNTSMDMTNAITAFFGSVQFLGAAYPSASFKNGKQGSLSVIQE
jgi:hypothetical protein